MAQRPIWRGHLRLALVSCPVALYSAKHDRGNIRFNLINPKTGNRVRMVTQDAETDDVLERKDRFRHRSRHSALFGCTRCGIAPRRGRLGG